MLTVERDRGGMGRERGEKGEGEPGSQMGGNCGRRERTGSVTPTWQKHGDIGGKVETLCNILEYKKH